MLRNKIKLIGLLIFTSIISSFAQIPAGNISLSGKWKLTWCDGSHGPKHFDLLATLDPALDPYKYLDADVPGEIHDVFRKAGVIGNPNIGFNSLNANWVADQYYQYYRKFTVPKESDGQEQWLVFDQLDLVADIYLNGKQIGSHNNAFYPCRINVTGKTVPGENTLSVIIESGLFSVAEKEGHKYSFDRGLQQMVDKRHYLRKPQYQFNWDWNPRYINVGISGDVRFEWAQSLRLEQLAVSQTISDNLSKAEVMVRCFVEGLKKNESFQITSTIKETGKKVSNNYELKQGINQYTASIAIENPKLWWPVGNGEQYRYTLVTEIHSNGKLLATETRKIGVRKVEVDQSPHPEKGNYFTIKINNRPIFMKGANWVPSDLVYSHITRSRLDSLVNLAVQANFNMIRVWGGGTYAGNDLLDLCDEKGIVVWHDFLFACSVYPGDDDEFYDEIRKEATWNVREFSHHPSLIVWGGNNENEWIFWDETTDKLPMADYVIYEHLLPLVLRTEKINVFYWPSSPHSKDKIFPNDPYTGDQHPWGVGFGQDDVNFLGYRKYEDRFANEGGVLGASSPATIRQMLGKDQYFMRSFSWDHHDNLMNFRKNQLGNTYRCFELFFGKEYDKVKFEDYILGSALLQAEGLQEYIFNYRRRKFNSSAAIFWMYSDSWPVTHGWTIVDYYLRKKLAYHPVRRAFDKVVTILAEDGDSIKVYGVNETAEDWKGKVNYGVFTLDGEKPVNSFSDVVIPSNTSKVLASFSTTVIKETGVDRCGGFAVLQQSEKVISQNRLLLTNFKNLKFSKPKINVQLKDGEAVFESNSFVWGVAIDIDGESDCLDNCFDILPGIPYKIQWKNKIKPVVLKTGNDLTIDILRE